MKILEIFELIRDINKEKSLQFCLQMFPIIVEKKNSEITIAE